MNPVESFHDETGRQPQEISQERYRSERRDRGFVRRALRRGVAAQAIEDRLLATTEFHRLNSERDPIAYIRGLIDEEGSGLRSLNLVETPSADSCPTSGNTPGSVDAAGRENAIHSEAMARRYIQENFEATDRLAVLLRDRDAGETIQRIATAQQIASGEFQSWLRHKNAHGSDIYLSLNPLREHAHGRTKSDVKEIRHLYLDLDEGGQRKLAAIYESPAVPHPNYVLQTSPDKYQAIWRVQGIPQNAAEDLLRSLARRFGGDPAATDATRVFRLPGFNNKKYEQDFPVKLASRALPEPVYQRSDFKIESLPHQSGSKGRTGSSADSDVHPDSPSTQSERDWGYAIRRLRQGDAPEEIVRKIAAYRTTDRHDPQDSSKLSAPKKPNPRYYAEHTVGRAMAHLGMAGGSLEQPSDQGERGSPDVEPPR